MDDDGGDHTGRWAHVAAPALGVEAGGAKARQLAELPRAATMVMDR